MEKHTFYFTESIQSRLDVHDNEKEAIEVKFHFLYKKGLPVFMAGILAILSFNIPVNVLSAETAPIETESVTLSSEEGDMANSFRYTNGIPAVSANIYSKASTSSNAWSKVGDSFVNDKGAIIPGAVEKGVDVSHHQGEINWKKVKASDVDFAIVRCGYGQDMESQDDKYWTANADACTKNNIPFGTYLYSYATTKEKAIGEANHVLRLVKGYDLQYPIYYDLEDISMEGLSAKQLATIAKAFCDTIEAAGYKAAIYANKYWFTSKLTDSVFDNYDRWVAEYNSTCSYTKPYTIWQSTSTGSVPGITGNADLNFVVQKEPLVPVTKLKTDNTAITINNTDTTKMNVQVMPLNAYEKRIKYTSNNEDVASVDENGSITAHKEGNAVITAYSIEDASITVSCTVTVVNSSLEIPTTPTTEPAVTAPVTEAPTATPAITAPVTEIPAASPAITAPATEIPAATPAITAPATETPTATPAITAPVTETPTATPAITAPAAESPIASPAITASVIETPTALPVITAPAAEVPTAPVVTEVPTAAPSITEQPIDKFILNKDTIELVTGKTSSLTIDTESFETVTWTSSNKSIATVSSKGKVTAVSPGKAVITAKLNSTISASCTIYVKPSSVEQADFSSSASNKLTLTWKKVTGASGYAIYRYDSNTKQDIQIKTVSSSKTSYAFSKINGSSGTALTAGRKYTYKIAAYKTIDNKKYYGSKITIKTATKPKKTTVNSLKKNSNGTVKVTWSKISASDGYIIYISNNKISNFQALLTIDSAKTKSYSTSRLTKGKTYYVKMCTYRKINGKIIYSNYSNTKKIKL